MSTFVKKDQLGLVNGGYLVITQGEKAVTNEKFVDLQVQAHYLVTLAGKVKGSNFKATEVANFAELKRKVSEEIEKEEVVSYKSKSEKPALEVTDALQKEALKWLDYQNETSVVDQVNQSMQKFNLLKEFEEYGLFFNDGIVKLKKIYTTAEIVEAVTVLQPHLN